MSSRKIFLLFFITLLLSCTEKLDFNQIENYVAKPVMTSSLVYFSITPNKFVDMSGNLIGNQISDITDFKIFQNKFVRDNLVKVVLEANVKNEFSRDFTIEVEFLNAGGTSLYTINPIIASANDLNYTYSEEIDVTLNPSFKNVSKVKVTATISNNGPPLNPNSTEEIEFKSAATVYIESSL